MPQAYRIRDWSKYFENNRTRELVTMLWMPVTTRQDGFSYIRLVDHPCGAASLGVWWSLLQTAAKCNPRGLLVRSDGLPHDFTTLHQVSRLPIADIKEAIPRLLEIGWLELCVVPGIENPPIEGAVSLRDGCGVAAVSAHYSTEENNTAAPPPQAAREAAAAAVLGLGVFDEAFSVWATSSYPADRVVTCCKAFAVRLSDPNPKRRPHNPAGLFRKLLADGCTPPAASPNAKGYPSTVVASVPPVETPAASKVTPEGIKIGQEFLNRRKSKPNGGSE